MRKTNPIRYIMLLLCVLCAQHALAAEIINIGVLSHRGDSRTMAYWADTANYLSRNIPGKQFRIVPLAFDEVEPSIREKKIHFLLVNPSIYVVMEVRHRISRIATLSRSVNGEYVNRFGGVVFTLSSRTDIDTLKDLRHHSLVAVDKTSFGGYQMAAREMKLAGVDPSTELSRTSFAGIHDAVVMAVLNKEADAGTVRTGILESMQANGLINLADIKIINPQSNDGFHNLHSTMLYPEWPFSKLQHTSNRLAEQVAIKLMEMHKDGADVPDAKLKNMWSIPLEYQPVHEALKDLRIPPYENFGKFTLLDAITKYRYWILSILLFALALLAMTVKVSRLNRELAISKQHLEQHHSFILNSVADGIYGVDTSGRSTFVNKAMEEMTGWKAEHAIGKNQHDLLHHTKVNGEPYPFSECPVYKTYTDNKPRYIRDDIFWRSDGTSFPVEYSSTPMKDGSGKTIGSVVIFRDISERKQAEENEIKHRRELAHVARVSTMGEMASGMAHELNQPLTAIATNADACLRLAESSDTGVDSINDALVSISKQARRAGAIIQQLRNFVRKELPEKSRVNLNDLIEEVLVLVGNALSHDAVELELNLAEDLPDIFVQHIQIDQVILNIVKNALEAMSENGDIPRRLVITTSTTDDNVPVVSISDTGPGFSDEMMKRLFVPFSTTKKDGMGLGLSISEGIISQHGGRLSVESSPGHGTTFKFTLPTQS